MAGACSSNLLCCFVGISVGHPGFRRLFEECFLAKWAGCRVSCQVSFMRIYWLIFSDRTAFCGELVDSASWQEGASCSDAAGLLLWYCFQVIRYSWSSSSAHWQRLLSFLYACSPDIVQDVQSGCYAAVRSGRGFPRVPGRSARTLLGEWLSLACLIGDKMCCTWKAYSGSLHAILVAKALFHSLWAVLDNTLQAPKVSSSSFPLLQNLHTNILEVPVHVHDIVRYISLA